MRILCKNKNLNQALEMKRELKVYQQQISKLERKTYTSQMDDMTLFNNIPSAQEYKVLRQQYQMQIQKLSNIFNKQCKIINQLDAEKRDLEVESSSSPSGDTILMQSQYFNK